MTHVLRAACGTGPAGRNTFIFLDVTHVAGENVRCPAAETEWEYPLNLEKILPLLNNSVYFCTIQCMAPVTLYGVLIL